MDYRRFASQPQTNIEETLDTDLICQGCYFMRSDPSIHRVVYGIALSDPSDGRVDSYCIAQGHRSKRGPSSLRSMTHLLSVQQFEMARHLGWPSTQAGLEKILTMPAD